MSEYDVFSQYDFYNEKVSIVVNCLVHMLSQDEININLFKRLIENGGVSGDIDWGIEEWNIYSEVDHGIKDKYEGYLFFIGEDEHGIDGKGELQVILNKDEIRPYIKNIIDWYSNIPNSNIQNFKKLAQKYDFY